jgi:hypothetical protein
MAGRESFEPSPVAAADDARRGRKRPAAWPSITAVDDVLVKGFAGAAWFLGAVEDGDGVGRCRAGRRREAAASKGRTRRTLYDADLLAAGDERLDRLPRAAPPPEPIGATTRSASGAPS